MALFHVNGMYVDVIIGKKTGSFNCGKATDRRGDYLPNKL
jgi:hypothetical protein